MACAKRLIAPLIAVVLGACSSRAPLPQDAQPLDHAQVIDKTDHDAARSDLFTTDHSADTPSPTGPKTLWVVTGGGEKDDGAQSCALDVAGMAYVGGEFEGAAVLGTTALASIGDKDGFVAKLDPNGNVVWAQSFGTDKKDSGTSVAVDGAGSLYLAQLIGLGPVGGTAQSLAKLDPGGLAVWTKSIGASPGGSAVGGKAIAVDSAGSVRVAGSFTGELNVGGTTLLSAGNNDCHVARFDPAGDVMWAVSAGGAGADSCQAVALDGQGNSHVVGFVESAQAKFGSLVTGSGAFLARLSPAGVPQSLLGGWTGGFYSPIGVAATPGGDASVVGVFHSQVTLGSQTMKSNGGTDVLVASVVGDKLSWAATAGGKGNDPGLAVALDTQGSIYVTGSFGNLGWGSATFGPFTVKSVANSGDVFVAKFGPDGTVQWVFTAGGDELDVGMCIAVGANGDVLVGGGFISKSAVIGGQAVTSNGQGDVFVWKFHPPDS